MATCQYGALGGVEASTSSKPGSSRTLVGEAEPAAVRQAERICSGKASWPEPRRLEDRPLLLGAGEEV